MKKTIKKIIAAVISAVLTVSAAVPAIGAVSAAPTWEQRDDSKIYFYANPEILTDVTVVTAYIIDSDGEAAHEWGSKKWKMTDEGNHLWSYDLGAGVSDGQYRVIFTADWKIQTNDLLFDKSCLGDLAYIDSNGDARWVNADRAVYGNPVYIDSAGQVHGNAYPEGESAASLLTGFMANHLEMLANHTDLPKRYLAHQTGKALGLDSNTVDAIARENSIDLGGSYDVYLYGDADGNGRVDISDATTIQMALADLLTLNEVTAANADADGNAIVDVNDVTCIQKSLADYADGTGRTGETKIIAYP